MVPSTPREYQTKEGEIRMSLDVGIYDWAYIGGKPKNEDGSDLRSRIRMPQERYIRRAPSATKTICRCDGRSRKIKAGL